MKSVVSSRVASLPQVGALALLAISAACSSSSGGPVTPPSVDGSTASSDGGQGVFNGDGGSCPTLTSVTAATKMTLDVKWLSTSATAGSVAADNPQLDIWLLSNYTISGTTVTGTTYTCQNQTPPFSLSAAGVTDEGQPAGSNVQIQITFDPSVWTSIMNPPAMRATQVTGMLGGWNIGSSFEINPTVSLYGLKASNPLASATAAWPMLETAFDPMGADFVDDDNDGYPGITATPSTKSPFFLPVTSQTPGSPHASKLFLVTRTELSLTGTSSSCTEGSGTATVNLLNNHVIGCELSAADVPDGADGGPALCDSSQTVFLDINTTQYTVLSGTYKTVQLSADGAPATCADVLTALP